MGHKAESLPMGTMDSMPFWEGVLAGYGIAVPVGAIAVLIIDTGLRRGFSIGFMAGAGAATVDFLYAAVAILAGATLASKLAPYAIPLRVASAVVLIILGSYGMQRAWRRSVLDPQNLPTRGDQNHLRTYAQFLGITLLNPLTIVYFAALVLGRDPGATLSVVDGLAFMLGAGIASLSWQTLLAGTGATARRYLSPRFQMIISLVGNLIVLALGVRILIQLIE